MPEIKSLEIAAHAGNWAVIASLIMWFSAMAWIVWPNPFSLIAVSLFAGAMIEKTRTKRDA
jgi:hypothetical protein